MKRKELLDNIKLILPLLNLIQEFQAEMKHLLLKIFGNQEDKPSQEICQKAS